MDERPEILGDLWALFRLDFWEQLDRPDIRLLMQCLERLPFEPFSVWRAKELGGEEWVGWDLHASYMADLIDAVNFQTSATAVNKKPKLKHPARRPEPEKKIEDRPVSVADMRWGEALAAMRG